MIALLAGLKVIAVVHERGVVKQVMFRMSEPDSRPERR
jgi:hypothetical protein